MKSISIFTNELLHSDGFFENYLKLFEKNIEKKLFKI